jgi:acetyl-CoA/propionyl-CoA carboxylase biotin carboxyl carrier protein
VDADETVEQTDTVEVSGRMFDVRVIGPPPAAPANGAAPGGVTKPVRAARTPRPRTVRGSDALASPMQGNVWKVRVGLGQQVAEGDVVTIIEAMKMENEITAHKPGVIAELPISEGDSVRSGDVLAVIRDPR